MRDSLIGQKVKVFISSNINDSFRIVRKALRDLLLESGMCDVYEFDHEPGTTCELSSAYLFSLRDSDIVIVLYNNSEDLGDGTLKEITEAKNLDKKIMYFFCSEQQKEISPLQYELQLDPKAPKFVNVDRMSDLAYEAYKSVICDIIYMYKAYCKNYLVDGAGEISYEQRNDKTYNNDTVYPRIALKGCDAEKVALQKELGIYWEKKTANVETNISSDFMRYVLGETELENIDFEALKDSIVNKSSKRLQKIISFRMDAMKLYFNGDYDNTINILQKSIDTCSLNKVIPEWIKNDIAIDLRNVQIEANSIRGVLDYNVKGQQILNESEEIVYYPVLDRINSGINEAIAHSSMKTKLASPFSYNLGGVDSVSDDIASAFSIALSFGSITNVLMIRKRLYSFLISECLDHRNHQWFILAVKQMILAGYEKELFDFWNAYGETSESITSKDAKEIYHLVSGIRNSFRKINAYITALHLFGYYFDDKDFSNFFAELRTLFAQSLKNRLWKETVVKRMITAIKNCSARITDTQILSIYFDVFDNQFYSWTQNVFELPMLVNVSELSTTNRKRLMRTVKQALGNEKIRVNCRGLYDCLVFIAKKDSVLENEIYSIIDGGNVESSYLDGFMFELDISKSKNIWKHIKNYLKEIDRVNKTQGVGGVYSGYAYSPYRLIENILISTGYKVEPNHMTQIIESVRNTLESSTQTYKAKCEALSMMIVAVLKSSRSKHNYIENFLNYIESDFDRLCTGYEEFLQSGYGPGLLLMEYGFLKSLVIGKGTEELIFGLPYISQSDVATQINATCAISRHMSLIGTTRFPITTVESIVQFLLSESYHKNSTIRFYALDSMIFFSGSTFGSVISARLSNMMDYDSFGNKIRILARLNDLPPSDQKDYIIQKGLSDNNYWVRKIAEKNM